MLLIAESISRQFLRKREGTNVFTALEKTDFSLAEGKVTVINGRSGSGKSTMLNILAGLLSPSTGRVTLDGRDIYALNDIERSKIRNENYGIVPQGQSALYSLNVIENILLPYTVSGAKVPEEVKKRADELCDMLDITDIKNVLPSELSGGEIRRMAIARAMIREPGIIFADEPTGDLDDSNTKKVLDFFKDRAALGCSVLLVTHDPAALEYADVLYSMDAGILKEGKIGRQINKTPE